MHKFILKIFDELKSLNQFFKILIVFTILMLILYWIQNISGSNWEWMSIIAPVLDLFLDLGNLVYPGSITLFGAVFEFKYLMAIIILIALYALVHFGLISVECSENAYQDTRRIIKKQEEKIFNSSLKAQQVNQQKKLKKYQIYVETFVKDKFSHKEFNIDMDEQNLIMNKFLMEKTGIAPKQYNAGFLYTFENFENVDDVLLIFSKLLQSNTPINYVICVQILGNDKEVEQKELDFLIQLKTLNKISAVADTVYRYGFNQKKKYYTSQLGIFKKDDKTYEVHEFNVY